MKAFRISSVVVVVLAVLPIGALQTVLATAASTLFESTPFILAGIGLAAVASRAGAGLVPFLGCGCGSGPSARSLPAAAATWLVFGPPVALARLAAATCIAGLLRPRSPCSHGAHVEPPLAQLRALLPIALGSGVVLHLVAPRVPLGALPPPAAAVVGAAFGFALSPCALGVVGMTAALRASAPAAAVGFLCVAGLADLRAFVQSRTHGAAHDTFAYAIAAAACAFVALHRGDTLVHPHFALALAGCALALAWGAWRFRLHRAPATRWAPLLMLAAALLGAPVPQYHATQTTLAGGFPGERVDFTGVLTRTGGVQTLVRFAITCCRADASPVVVRLGRALPIGIHGWVHATGTLEQTTADLRLRVDRYERVPAPTDPFVYR